MKKITIITLLFMALISQLTFAQQSAKTVHTLAKKHHKHIKFDYVVTISTEFGDMKAILFDITPKHKENFMKLAERGFYDGTTFHRVIPNFMIQGGDSLSKDTDPNNDGTGGMSYTLPAEIKDSIMHIRGALAAARLGDAVNPAKESNGSQFYVVQNLEGTPWLDGQYTVFGEVFDNLEVLDKIVQQPRDGRDRPLKDIKMKVTVKKMKKKKITQEYGYVYL